MNVDNTNFFKLLPQILSDLEQCDFVSFDGEFSGLKTIPFASEDQFQSEEEFYQRMKDTCINFCLLQLGLCMFRWRDGKYVPACYNFYIKNNTANGRKANNILMAQVDCLDFLSRNKMDFKRVFHRGITSTRLSEKQLVEKKSREGIRQPPKEYVFLQKQDQLIVQQITEKVAEFKKSDQKELIIDFVNKSVFSEVKRRLNLQLEKDPKLKNFEYILRSMKNQPKGYKLKEAEVQPKPQTAKKIEEGKVKNTEKPEKVQEEEVAEEKSKQPKSAEKKKEEEKKKSSESDEKPQVKQRIEEEMGLSLVIEQMIRLKRPLIGHFASLDLGFLYQTFIGELPNTYEEFCRSLRERFPYILDTKVISKKVQHSIKGLRVDLSSLFDSCFDQRLLKPYTNVDLSVYEGAECQHQAGYDAYITGSCLVAMLNYIHQHPEEVPREGRQHHKANDRKKPNKREAETPLVHPRIDFGKCQYNGIIYSKFSGEVVLDGKESNKFDNRIIIVEGSIEAAAEHLSQYGSLRIAVRELNYAKFDEDVNTGAIIESYKSENFKLVHYRDRRQFRARKYLE